MKILMLSWEYPPKNVGGLSNHVHNLSKALKNAGNDIHILTCADSEVPLEEQIDGVFVHRVLPYSIETEDFTKWVMHLNFAMIEAAVKILNKEGKFDIIHAHDWLTLYTAKVLKYSYKIPVICTIHATESGRNGGIYTDMQKYISSAEWNLTYEAWKIIVCSSYMKGEVAGIFTAPSDKIRVIPNGISIKAIDDGFDLLEFRRGYASDDEKMIFYVGRHVYEKGIQHLIEAVPDVVDAYGNIKFVIAGNGAMTDELMLKVRNFGLESKVMFTGYIDDDTKFRMYKAADAAVFPSLYEPFGIVALEAMAANCPVIVSDVGGFKEIIEHKKNGLKVVGGSKESIKHNILELLLNKDLQTTVREYGLKTVIENYRWDKIALDTIEVYKEIQNEAKGTEWEAVQEKPKKKTQSRKNGKKKDLMEVV